MTFDIRPVTPDDRIAVSELLTSIGWPQRSAASWKWLFEDNPSRTGHDADAPIGWVVQSNDGLHGYLANIHLDYAMAGEPIRAATCSNYYVAEAARASGFKLLTAFFRQKNIDLYLSTTANKNSAPLYKMFKAVQPEDRSFQKSLFWLTDNEQFIRDGSRAAKFVPTQFGSTAPILGPLLKAMSSGLGYRPPTNVSFDGEVHILTPNDIGEDFDTLWGELKSGNRLVVRRDAEMLRWYLSDPDLNSHLTLFAAYDRSGLVGYSIAGRHQPAIHDVARYKVIDLVVRDGAVEAIDALVASMCTQARQERTGVLQVARVGAALADHLLTLRPMALDLPIQSHYVRSTKRQLMTDVIAPDRWAATGLDGDGPFVVFDAQKKRATP